MTAQNFATSSDPLLGPISLGILYFFWIISLSTISTSVVNSLTPKYAMFIGSLTYPMYVASGIKLSSTLFASFYMMVSVLIGIGAGFLWVGQSILIVQCANVYERSSGLSINSRLGTFNGSFNLGMNMSRFVGSLIAAVIFQFNGSVQTMFIVMIVIGVAGSMTFLFIRKMDLVSQPPTNTTELQSTKINSRNLAEAIECNTVTDKETKDASVYSNTSQCAALKDEINDIALLWKNSTFLCLIPITLSFGLFQTFIAGDIAVAIKDNALKFYVLTIVGFMSGLSSLIIGKCADRYSPLIFIFITCTVFTLVYIFFYFWHIEQEALWIWITVAVLLGFGDGALLTLVPQIYPILLGNANAVFANMRILQSIALLVGFAYYPITSFVFRISFNLVIMVLGAVCVLKPLKIRNALFHKAEQEIVNQNAGNDINAINQQKKTKHVTSPSSS
eukprot:422343_1